MSSIEERQWTRDIPLEPPLKDIVDGEVRTNSPTHFLGGKVKKMTYPRQPPQIKMTNHVPQQREVRAQSYLKVNIPA